MVVLLLLMCICLILMTSGEAEISESKLVYTWPVSYCHTLAAQTCPHHLLPDKFVIHGLWAYNSSGIINCNNIPNIIPPSTVDPQLARELDKIWIALGTWSSNYDFWMYEWYKHGACLNSGTPVAYFRKVLILHNLLVSRHVPYSYPSLLHMLKSEGYPPSNNKNFLPQDFLDKISKLTSLAPELKCINVYGKPVEVYELTFCITPQGLFKHCNKPTANSFYQSSQCSEGTKGKIILPELPKPPPPPPSKRKSYSPPPPPVPMSPPSSKSPRKSKSKTPPPPFPSKLKSLLLPNTTMSPSTTLKSPPYPLIQKSPLSTPKLKFHSPPQPRKPKSPPPLPRTTDGNSDSSFSLLTSVILNILLFFVAIRLYSSQAYTIIMEKRRKGKFKKTTELGKFEKTTELGKFKKTTELRNLEKIMLRKLEE